MPSNSVLTSALPASPSALSPAAVQPNLPHDFEHAITIVSTKWCTAAVEQAQRDFAAQYPDPTAVCLMPILRGGRVYGEALAQNRYKLTPMRMSYYNGGERLPEPVCLIKPSADDLIGPDGRTLPVVFAEGVIETYSTIRASVKMVEALCDEYGIAPPPYYEAQALAIKRPSVDELTPTLPNAPLGADVRIVAQFWVHINIWIHGMGTDDDERGRDLYAFAGRLSPFADYEPAPPYFEVLNPRLSVE